MSRMITHTKRLSAGVSSAVLLVALLAGCSSTPSDESTASATTSASAVTSPTAGSAETEAEAEQSAEPDDSSASVEAFCADARSLIDDRSIEVVDLADVDAVNAVVADMTARIDSAVEIAPTEIAADWTLFSGGMKQVLSAVQGFAAAGATPGTTAQAEWDAASEFMSSSEVGAATENLYAYLDANCEA